MKISFILTHTITILLLVKSIRLVMQQEKELLLSQTNRLTLMKHLKVQLQLVVCPIMEVMYKNSILP